MPNRKLILFSVTLLLATAAIISVFLNTAVANLDKETANPEVGEYLLIKKYPDQQTVRRGKPAQFSIIVSNIDSEVNLTDVRVLDLLAPDCNRTIGNLPADSNFPTYDCLLDTIEKPMVSWAAVQGKNPVNGETDFARDSARIDLIDISVAVAADPLTIPSPGGEISFSVNISNTGSVTVALRSLTSPQFGDLTNPENGLVSANNCLPNPNLPLIRADGESVSCTFKAEILGEAALYPVEITAVAVDKEENNVANTGFTTVSVSSPASHTAYIPFALDTVDEPNDSCSTAYPLLVNQTYQFFPDDEDDWYYFDLTTVGNVMIELSNFVPRFGQIIIYEGGQCNSLQVLKNNGNEEQTKPVPLGVQPPGRYYILVINAGKPNAQVPYKLQVHFQEN